MEQILCALGYSLADGAVAVRDESLMTDFADFGVAFNDADPADR